MFFLLLGGGGLLFVCVLVLLLLFFGGLSSHDICGWLGVNQEGARIAQLVKRQIRDRKVAGSNPG